MKTVYRFMLLGLLASLVSLTNGCVSKESPDKKERLLSLLKNEFQISGSNRQIAIVLNAGCDPCLEKSAQFINKIGADVRYRQVEKIVIFSNDDKLFKMIENTATRKFRDSKFLLAKYGLQLSNNFLVEFDENKNVVYFNDMTTQTIESVNAHYHIN